MEYDRFQKEAIEHIKNGHSVIVSAPTGAGKTVIAEHVILDCLAKGENAIYTAPIKALSNQKFRDFQKEYSDKIGILTGDVSINADAPILIMTTEIFRNKILAQENDLEKYSWIIFDEIHYLDDYERGSVWEESLIFLPHHMKMLALSATIPNIDEFADWLKSIHNKPIHIVKEDNRPVPLTFYYQCQGQIISSLHELKRIGFGKDLFTYSRNKKKFNKNNLKPNKLAKLIDNLYTTKKLPCIYFVFSRKRSVLLAKECSHFNFLSDDEYETITDMYMDLCEKFSLQEEASALEMLPLIQKGIAFHHAGMLPTLKEVIERLFTSRLIKLIFTTETFALGINMPARTVIFDELRKFYGTHFGPLRTRDFFQMAGRAGRRGIDDHGFVYSRVNPMHADFDDIKNSVNGNYEKVRSRFNASYATILNLYKLYGEKLYDIYPYSFHFFQEKSKRKDKAVQMMKNKVDLLKELGYIKDNKVTEKGEFASNVYGYELLLAEFYGAGFLEQLTEYQLAMLIIALIYEPRKGAHKPPLTKPQKNLKNLTDQIENHVHYMEKKFNIWPKSKTFFLHLSLAIDAWMHGENFEAILQYTDADEGEIIRYFRMSIQVLREILEANISEEFRKVVFRALDLLKRDIVDAEKQLRIED
ncbi:MAG: DEAD/DEAH box helicase [Candidatus Omnitrophica bacterium]|nr:DEAD/DEAH box helicase [Candidatus Omnitrophota bacterium]